MCWSLRFTRWSFSRVCAVLREEKASVCHSYVYKYFYFFVKQLQKYPCTHKNIYIYVCGGRGVGEGPGVGESRGAGEGRGVCKGHGVFAVLREEKASVCHSYVYKYFYYFVQKYPGADKKYIKIYKNI